MNTMITPALKSWTANKKVALNFNPLERYLKFADGQKDNRTMWWFVNLMVHGNLVLAIPAVLIFYFNANVMVLAVTVLLFFANLVANMGGMGIRITLSLFFASLAINILMVLFCIL